MRNQYERRTKHSEIPIIDAAGRTATVFHKPRLERTEKQNADHITHAVREADQDQDPRVDQSDGIEQGDRGIACDPDGGDETGLFGRLYFRLLFVRRQIVFLKLLLATGTF